MGLGGRTGDEKQKKGTFQTFFFFFNGTFFLLVTYPFRSDSKPACSSAHLLEMFLKQVASWKF